MIHIYGAFHEAALERAIENLFQALDKPSLEKLFKKLASKEGIKIPNISAQIITSTFRFLLQAPLEYLSRSSRRTLLCRAVAADIILSENGQKYENALDADNARLAIRLWNRSQADTLSTIEVCFSQSLPLLGIPDSDATQIDWADFVTFLSKSVPSTGLNDDLEEATLELLVEVFRSVSFSSLSLEWGLRRKLHQIGFPRHG